MLKYYDKVSFKSKLINFIFKFTNSKKIFSNEDNTVKYINKISSKNRNYNLPDKMGLNCEKICNTKIYTYNGSLDNLNDKVLVYFHGGSFIEEAISYQIRFAMKIANKTNSTLIMPIYPLVPKGNYKMTYNLMNSIYKNIKKSDKDINLLGDSAGGGFILSYCMYLRESKIKQPNNIIMLSPWLDISMSNKELLLSEKKDPISGINGNKYIGRLWADGLDIKNYLVSPIYGNFKGLGKMTIITGSRDILQPDCILLSNKLRDLNISHNYIEYKEQGHDFGAYPTKEGNMVIQNISDIINSGGNIDEG